MASPHSPPRWRDGCSAKYHLRNILDKLHVQNRAQVVAYAMRYGLVDGAT